MANPKDRAAAVARKLVRVRKYAHCFRTFVGPFEIGWDAYKFDADRTYDVALKGILAALRKAGIR